MWKKIRRFAGWISVCKPCKGMALLCFVTVATQFWQTPHAGDTLGPKESWFKTAAMGNRLLNSKTWHRIWLQDFLTGCDNMSICIVTWRGSALFLDKAQNTMHHASLSMCYNSIRTHRRFTICTIIKPLHLFWLNWLHSFCLFYVGEKTTEVAFH